MILSLDQGLLQALDDFSVLDKETLRQDQDPNVCLAASAEGQRLAEE